MRPTIDARPAAIEKAEKRLARAKRRLEAQDARATKGQRKLNEKQMLAMATVIAQGQRYTKEPRVVFTRQYGASRSSTQEVVIIRSFFGDEIQVQCQQLMKRRLMYIERSPGPNRGRHVVTALGLAVFERDQPK